MERDIIEGHESEHGEFDYFKYSKLILGVLLVVFGIVVAGWVFFKVVSIFDNPASLENFLDLFKIDRDFLTFKIDNAVIEIPKEFFHIVVYLAAISLFGVLVSLAGVLITGGVNLMHSSLKRIENKIDKVSGKVEQIKQKLR